MATRPTVKPRWATSDVNNGPLGGANVIEPTPEAKKDRGWDAGEKPPRETFNWLQRYNYLWIDYLDEVANNALPKAGGLMSGTLGIIAGTAAAPGMYFNGTTSTGFYSPSGNRIGFSTAGLSRAVITETGNLILGSSADSYGTILQVHGGIFIRDNLQSDRDYYLYSYSGGAGGQVKAGVKLTGSADSVEFYTNNTHRGRISAVGNWLVGTNTDNGGDILQVAGSMRVTASATSTINSGATSNVLNLMSSGEAYLGFWGASSRRSYIQASSSGMLYVQEENLPIRFYTNNTERGRITNGGNFELGTSLGTADRLQVDGSIRTNGGVLGTSFTAINGTMTTVLNHDGAGSYLEAQGVIPLRFYTGGSERARLHSNGNMSIGSATDVGHKLYVNGTARFDGNSIVTGTMAVANATSPGHAVNLGQADARYLQSMPSATTSTAGSVRLANSTEEATYSGAGVPTMASLVAAFDANNTLATEGSQVFPGGLILKWGTVTVITGGALFKTAVQAFPAAFPNACFFVGGNANAKYDGTSLSSGSGPLAIMTFSSFTTTNFRYRADSNVGAGGGTFTFSWFAIGN